MDRSLLMNPKVIVAAEVTGPEAEGGNLAVLLDPEEVEAKEAEAGGLGGIAGEVCHRSNVRNV